MLIGTVYLVIDKQTKFGMGTIDETYVNNNNNNNGNESSESEIINRTKYPTMIPSSVQNQNLMSSETAKGNFYLISNQYSYQHFNPCYQGIDKYTEIFYFRRKFEPFEV